MRFAAVTSLLYPLLVTVTHESPMIHVSWVTHLNMFFTWNAVQRDMWTSLVICHSPFYNVHLIDSSECVQSGSIRCTLLQMPSQGLYPTIVASCHVSKAPEYGLPGAHAKDGSSVAFLYARYNPLQ